jgi:pimeloyl-ACP methyl ester carboxylesterase
VPGRRLRIASKVIFTCCVLGSAAIFALGAVAAQNAMRPPRLPVALACPCFSHMHCESVAITAKDGIPLRAWYYTPDTPTTRMIILLHGIGSTRQDMVALGYLFLRHGYSVLEPDLRGHGESGGLATYGVLEGTDIHRWVDWMEKTENSPALYGFGASLGASVLLESLKEESRFHAVVAESPYYDFPSIARERIARMLPSGLKWVTTPFVASGIRWAQWHDGVDLHQASAADGLRSTKTPVFLIHGLEDNKTSPENSRRLASVKPVQLWLVPGSHHADAWTTAPQEFESKVIAWFGAY